MLRLLRIAVGLVRLKQRVSAVHEVRLPLSAFACPGLDLGSEPELAAPRTHVDYGSWHVGIAPLVAADGVELGEAEHRGDGGRVDQVVNINAASHSAEPISIDMTIAGSLRFYANGPGGA